VTKITNSSTLFYVFRRDSEISAVSSRVVQVRRQGSDVCQLDQVWVGWAGQELAILDRVSRRRPPTNCSAECGKQPGYARWHVRETNV